LDTRIYQFSIFLPDHSAPDIIYLSGASEDELEFSWTPVASDIYCSSLLYRIASDCGTCQYYITSETIANCFDLQLTTSAIECHFRVSSVVCDLSGDPSFPVAVILKGNIYNIHYKNVIMFILLVVPNFPQAKLIPSYSNDNQALEMVYIITTTIQTVSVGMPLNTIE
jgi:hypothetical protein